MLRKRLILPLLAVGLTTGGCVEENWDVCDELIRLNYAHTLNPENQNNLSSVIKDIRVWAYDAHTGKLVATFRANQEDIQRGFDMIGLPDGDYRLVGWASSNPDMAQSGLNEVQGPPPTTALPPPPTESVPPPIYQPLTPGQSTIDNSLVTLDTNPAGDNTSTPSNGQFGDVFTSPPPEEETVIRDGRSTEEIEMDFQKNSALISLRINGLQNLPPGTNGVPNVFMIGRNGALRPDGTVDPNAPSVRYQPYDVAANQNAMEAQFQTLKLELSKETTQPMMLYIQDRITGRDIAGPLNVQTMLRSVRNAQGQLLYPNQEAIDRETQFRIMMEFNSTGRLSVSVNDFIVESLEPIIETP